MIVCADGLSGIKEAIATAFPNTEYQRCLVHQVRNTLKYVPDKDRKAFAKDLKTIYNAPTEEEGRKTLDKVTEKWEEKYPRAMKRWYDNWDAICPIFKFSSEVRTVIYTTYTDKITMPIFQRKPDKQGSPKKEYRHSFCMKYAFNKEVYEHAKRNKTSRSATRYVGIS